MFELDQDSRQLLTVAGLPLVDGVFVSLLVSGSLDGFSSLVAVALTVFAGAGSVAVLLSNAESRRDAREMVYSITPYLLSGALVVAMVAPVFREIFSIARLQYVTGAVLVLVALKLADIEFAERIDTAHVLVPGMLLSFQGFAFSLSLSYVVPAAGTVLVAVLAFIGFTFLKEVRMNMEIIQKGSAFVLGLFAASMFGLSLPSEAGLLVFSLAFAGSIAEPRLRLG